MGDRIPPIPQTPSSSSENRSSSSTRRPPFSSSTSSELNLPPNMSRTSLSLENPSFSASNSSHIDRMVGVGYHPSPSRTIYSDRFIPSRSGSNFALFDLSPSSGASTSSGAGGEGGGDGAGTYANLLKSVLFGPDSGVVSPLTPEKTSTLDGRSIQLSPPSRNIFRYKTETRQSMYSLSPFGFDDALPGVIPSPAKATRKVPRSPYKVCNLVWSKNVNELVSTHGYSQNQIIVWRYPTMSKLATLTGHTYRVLYLAISPDGQTIVTGAGYETLRFWNVFPSPKSQNSDSDIGASSLGRTQIR